MIFPCCRTELPEKLDGVEKVICNCGMSYLPKVIIEYNDMMDIIEGWSAVVCGKAYIKCSTKAGDIILDPFAGSGTTLKIAEELHRKGIGIDLGYHEISKRRTSKIQKQLFV